jgi:cytochrome c oxidase subunit IV
MENIHHHHHPDTTEEAHHGNGFQVNTLVWIDLLILTLITVRIAFFDLQNLTVTVALLVASVKTYLVGTYFMHLKSESKIISIFIGLVLLVFVLVMVILFSDYLFRKEI